ncbi:MAG TPA: hypothetical protein VF773_07110 [Verrucomicrobiae bacterium]
MRGVKQLIDRQAIKVAAESLPQGVPRPALVSRARELLGRADFLAPGGSTGQLKLHEKDAFTFASAVETPQQKNNTVHGKLFRTRKSWATRPLVILVHGWNAELHFLYGLPWVARALNRRGLNAALIELPYHLHRRPLERNGMRDFISDDLVGMLEATRQALADFDALGRWAKAQGCPSVGIWGFSLGAWLAGLYVCQTDFAKAAVLTTPVIDLERAVKELAFCHPIRSSMAAERLDLSALNLTRQRLRIAPEGVQLVESGYDLFVPEETYAELARDWKLPRWEKQPQGHISILTSRRAMRQSMDFFARNL